MDYWKWMTERASDNEIRRSMLVMWCIWSYRNKLHSSTGATDVAHFITWVDNHLQENFRAEDSHLRECILENHLSHGSWEPPPSVSWKVNTDASWCDSAGKGGIGWIVRDSNGSPICAGHKTIRNHWPIKMLEAMAIKEGLLHLQSFGDQPLPPVVVDSDAADVVNVINKFSIDLSKISIIADEIEDLANRFCKMVFHKCSRSTNLVEHHLARKAADLPFIFEQNSVSLLENDEGEGVFWNYTFPMWLVKCLYEGWCRL